MKIGVQVSSFNWPGSPANIGKTFAQIGQTADEAGFSSLWVMDHFFQIQHIGPAEDPMLEGYSLLNFLAGVTKNITLGTLVTGVIYRHPGILLKTVTTLDVLSGGRAWLGIGAGWYEAEAKGLGVPYPSTKVRFEQLEETLQLAHQMWKDDEAPFHGAQFQLERPMNHPQPLSKPHPPIMIGGMGEQKTLRMVAQYADACNLFAGAGNDVIRGKLDTLKQHCENVGRNYEDIERTVITNVDFSPGAMTAQDVVAHCKDLAQVGVQHAIFSIRNVHEITPLEIIGRDVIPAVAEF